MKRNKLRKTAINAGITRFSYFSFVRNVVSRPFGAVNKSIHVALGLKSHTSNITQIVLNSFITGLICAALSSYLTAIDF